VALALLQRRYRRVVIAAFARIPTETLTMWPTVPSSMSVKSRSEQWHRTSTSVCFCVTWNLIVLPLTTSETSARCWGMFCLRSP